MKKGFLLLLALLLAMGPMAGMAEVAVYGASASGPLVDGGTVYRVQDGALWSREANADWEELGKVDGEFQSARLVAGDGRLFILDAETGEMAEISRETGATEGEYSLDWEDMALELEDYETVRPIDRAFVSGDKLYVLTYEDDFVNRILLRFDLESGDCEAVEVENVFDIASDGDGNAVAVIYGYSFTNWEGAPKLVRLDLEAEEIEEICELPDEIISGLAWDRESERAYFIQNGRLMTAGADTEAQLAGYVSLEIYGMAVEAWAGEDSYALAYEDDAYFLSTDPADLPERVLTVAGIYDNAATAPFREAHPEIPVINANLDSARLLEGLISGSTTADVYALTLGSSEMQAILGRNYAQALDGESVARAIEAMYPQFAEAMKSADGRVMAFPYFLSAYCLGYSPEVLAALGLGEEDLPETWEELFQFIARWQVELADEYPEYTIFEKEQLPYLRDSLFAKLMNSFLASEGELNQEALQAALEALGQVDFEEFGEDAERMGAMAISVAVIDGTDQAPTSLFTMNKAPILESYDFAPGYELLPLKISDEAEATVFMDIEVLFVNPHSPNLDLALEMIDLWAENMSGLLKANLMPGENAPVENPYFDQMMESAKEQVTLARQALANASEDDRESYEQVLEEAEDSVAWLEEKYRYYATEEEIALYRERAGEIQPKVAQGLGQDDGETEALVQRFYDGQMDAKAFVQAFAKRLEMMRLENS